MIKMIEIIIKNGSINETNALISFRHSFCIYNNKKYRIDDSFKDNIIRIIRTWEHEYGSSKNIDDSEFKVIVTTDDNKQDIFHGKGFYPENYDNLIKILGDLNG